MSVVHVDVRELSGLPDNYTPEDGAVWFSPFRAYHVEDGPDDFLVSSEILKVRLVDGVAEVDLPETPVDNLMKVQLRGVRGYGEPFYVRIPATDCNLFDLQTIDPDTMDPVPGPDPAWLEPLNDEIARATEREDDLQDQIDAVEASDVDSVAGLSGTVTAAGLKTAISLPTDTVAELALKQDIASLSADTAAHVSDASALDVAVAAKIAAGAGVEAINFTNKATVPTVADTGQPITVTGDLDWQIDDGLTVVPDPAGGVAYFQRPVEGRKVTHLYRRFTIGAGSTDGSSMALITWDAELVNIANVPDSHCHAGTTRTGWAYHVIEANDIVLIGTSNYATPLPIDTELEMSIDIVQDTATLSLPDGSTVVLRDPRIASINGSWAVDETTQVNGTTDRPFRVLESRHTTNPQGRAVDIEKYGWAPRDNGLIAATGSPAECGFGAALATIALATRVRVPAGETITNIHAHVAVASSGNTYAKAAIYEKSGVGGPLAGITASIISDLSTTGDKVLPLVTPIAAQPVDRDVWVTYLTTGGTPPTLLIHGYLGTFTANVGLGSVGYLNGGYYAVTEPLPATLPVHALTNYYQYWVGLS